MMYIFILQWELNFEVNRILVFLSLTTNQCFVWILDKFFVKNGIVNERTHGFIGETIQSLAY